MHKTLARREDEWARFQETFAWFRMKNGWQGRQEKTVLQKDICDAIGSRVCAHLCFNLTRVFASLNLQLGDVVAFDARVKAYEKEYFGRHWDVYKPAEVDYQL